MNKLSLIVCTVLSIALFTGCKKEMAVHEGDNTTRGIVLVTYNGVPLGFVKNLGNRANNMYPQEWRIRISVS